jgi:hypothetical protein
MKLDTTAQTSPDRPLVFHSKPYTVVSGHEARKSSVFVLVEIPASTPVRRLHLSGNWPNTVVRTLGTQHFLALRR